MFQRLAISAANVAYGIKGYPGHGPFPQSFQVQGSDNNLTITYDSGFVSGNKSYEATGFYICCEKSKVLCDHRSYEWDRVPKTSVTLNPAKKIINVAITERDCFQGMDRILLTKPMWLAFEWENSPVKEDFGGALYGDDKFALPAPMWRCIIQWKDSNHIGGCTFN